MDPSSFTKHPRVRAARADIHASDEETLAEQLRIVVIPAPSYEEAARAAYVERRFREQALSDVSRDAAGNVIGRLARDADGPPVIVSAHLDTVFASDTELEPRRSGTRISAPGITDNARGLAVLVTLAGVMNRHRFRLSRPVHFVATVGEEGAGDLRGAKHLLRDGGPFRAASAFVSLDGSGLRRVVHRGIGSRRLRVTVTGPGGHSWSDWGAPNAVHALGAAIHGITTTVPLSREPPSTVTVARIAGGSSINAIPEECWAEIDIRSEAPPDLERIEADCLRVFHQAVEEENARRRPASGSLRTSVQVIGDRPAGSVPPTHPIVLAAQRATRAVGARPELAASSTDSNIALSLGIPAITIGAGGQSGGIHTRGEWYDNRGGALGTERALLLLLDLAGLNGS